MGTPAVTKANFHMATNRLMDKLRERGLAMDACEQEKTNPIRHSFGDGIYMRSVFYPADELIIGKIHKFAHPFFLLRGSMVIITEDGSELVEAPHSGITPAGLQRIGVTLTDCEFTTCHVTDKTDPDEIEEELVTMDFDAPELAHLGVSEILLENES